MEELKAWIHNITDIREHIDTAEADLKIRNNIPFKGPNVWILAFSIIIASVGLNVNSTAVIIGAMLISPLMGPIFGIGLGLGENDTTLIRRGLKNLLVMVVISLLASTLYFVLTPLKLANPTELLARTNPTIYDVLIALFGGLAGIFELSRKEKGTVLSGVAIATALMPPLCTAGYGLASLNFHYFIGALFLFCINGVFIILATYAIVKYLGFPEVKFLDPSLAKKTKTLITAVIVVMMVPSVWSAVTMIRQNKFTQEVSSFVEENKTLSKGYIYDYEISHRKGGKVKVYIAGEAMTENDRNALIESAKKHGIGESQISFNYNTIAGGQDNVSEKLMKGIYERTDLEISRREAEIRALEEEVKTLKGKELPYNQLAREIRSQYPEIMDIYITRGARVNPDSTNYSNAVLVVAKTSKPLNAERKSRLNEWLKIRLNDNSAEIIEQAR